MLRRLCLHLLIAAFVLQLMLSGMPRALRAKVKAHTWGKTESAKPAKIYLALCTVVPTETSTGATLTEATGATGYARKEIPIANLSVTEAETVIIELVTELIFAAITAGSATITGWGVLDSPTVGEGNVVEYGSASSTAISATQTPPTIPAKTLKGELK